MVEWARGRMPYNVQHVKHINASRNSLRNAAPMVNRGAMRINCLTQGHTIEKSSVNQSRTTDLLIVIRILESSKENCLLYLSRILFLVYDKLMILETNKYLQNTLQ